MTVIPFDIFLFLFSLTISRDSEQFDLDTAMKMYKIIIIIIIRNFIKSILLHMQRSQSSFIFISFIFDLCLH